MTDSSPSSSTQDGDTDAPVCSSRVSLTPSGQPTSALQHASTAPLALAHRTGLMPNSSPMWHAREADSFVRKSANFGAELSYKARMLTSAQTIQGLLAFSVAPSQNNVEDRAAFAKEVAQTRRRIRSISRRTLSPRSRFVRSWDAVTMVAMAFTACLLYTSPSPRDS